ncbi:MULTISPECIES: DUF6344 domain-containing protein [unclassified Streptomyces]|uniref:DUF6344 domain-containing protein n=1 Tax=unclassified Streptomyces TaxID=2593676 RepID=UPI00382A3D51
MAATKVMKFWAVCLAVLGKLLASLGVSAPASAARREAALYEAALRTADATSPRTTGAASRAGTRRDPEAVSCAAPAKSVLPLYGPAVSDPRMASCPQLPPTIKQRIRAEAHGASPTSRTRLTAGVEPLSTVAEAALHSGTGAGEQPTVAIPAARRRGQHTAYAA